MELTKETMDKETKELLKRTLAMTDDKLLLKFAKSYAALISGGTRMYMSNMGLRRGTIRSSQPYVEPFGGRSVLASPASILLAYPLKSRCNLIRLRRILRLAS